MLVKLYRNDGSVFEVPGNQVKEFLAMGLTEEPPVAPKAAAKKAEPVEESTSAEDSGEDSPKKRSYTKK